MLIAQVPWDNGNLMASENGRYLQHENGDPFFWLGDTGWLLFQRLDRMQAEKYLKNRKEKGFNVIQCIFHQNFSHVNAYGDTAYSSFDITKPIITKGNDRCDDVGQPLESGLACWHIKHQCAESELDCDGSCHCSPVYISA